MDLKAFNRKILPTINFSNGIYLSYTSYQSDCFIVDL